MLYQMGSEEGTDFGFGPGYSLGYGVSELYQLLKDGLLINGLCWLLKL